MVDTTWHHLYPYKDSTVAGFVDSTKMTGGVLREDT